MPSDSEVRLFPVLGDQLSPQLASLRHCRRDRDVVLMAEVGTETGYVPHHKKKLVFILSAMRHFARALQRDGYRVDYVRLEDPDNSGSLTGEIERAVRRHRPKEILVTESGEYRVDAEIAKWRALCETTVFGDDRFYLTRSDFADWARDRKQWRMEFFYRDMRKRFGILLQPDGSPEGGRWNFDAENRKPLQSSLFLPRPFAIEPDEITCSVIDMVERLFPDHLGRALPFHWAVTREEARRGLEGFVRDRLALFGDHQDAMQTGNPFLYHAQIGLYLNCGLLDPRECVQAAEDAYRAGQAPLNAVEGFIRQILGWREFVRGLYWMKMPRYAEENALGATRPLPALYWGAPTRMNCLAQAVGDTIEFAYAHHIQRLMVLGNFALLAGISPKEVQRWFLAVYADAFEWVELPNVSGMALFADGGLLASKPYAASGAYLGRMSDYCGSCGYETGKRSGAKACPFNFLFWDFLRRHRERFNANPRLSMLYRTYDRFSAEERRAIGDQAESFLQSLERGEAV